MSAIGLKRTCCHFLSAIGLKNTCCHCHNMFDSAAGFGGYKQSGYGRDGGKEVRLVKV